jgi:hypothetical protein
MQLKDGLPAMRLDRSWRPDNPLRPRSCMEPQPHAILLQIAGSDQPIS